MVLGRAAQHGRPTDIDLLDRFGKQDVGLCNRLLKRVEVNHHQIDQGNARLFGLTQMILVVTQAEQPTVYLGVQGLNPAIHHLRESRMLTHLNYLHPVILQKFRRTARGKYVITELIGQCLGKRSQSRFVAN